MALQLAELRDRIAEWAAHHHRDELLAATERHLTPASSRSESAVLSAIAFALIVPSAEGPSLLERYAAEPRDRPRAERVLLQRCAATWFGVLRIVAVELDRWFDVHDVVRDIRLRIHERSATHTLDPGRWLAAFYHQADDRWVFEGSVLELPPQSRIYAVQAALRACAGAGVGPAQLDPARSRRIAGPTLAAIHRTMRPPRLVNADRHEVVMVTSTIGLPWQQVVEVVGAWRDAQVDEDQVALLGDPPAVYSGGHVTRGVFGRDDGVVTLFTNSRERHDTILERWRSATGEALPVEREEVARPQSDPLGVELIVDASSIVVPEGADPQAYGDRAIAALTAGWLDTAIPLLDGLTPREALARGRRAELWALMSPDEDWIAAELGLVDP